jgi:O-antigen ligase
VDTPWVRGLGDVSHENEFGILVELGLVGFVVWICVLGAIAYRLRKAYRALPDNDLCGRPLVVTAIMAFAILICTGFTVDLRYFDFATAAIFLIVGIALGSLDRVTATNSATSGDVPRRVLVRNE